MKKLLFALPLLLTTGLPVLADHVINVDLVKGDATKTLQTAIDKAADYNGEHVTIKLEPGEYNISRNEASAHLYHVSNTTSIYENPDLTKHIGMWFRNLRNITFDGNGAKIITHGEMTSFAIDSCSNIKLMNYILTSADPSVPEIKILERDANSIIFEVVPPSEYVADDKGFYFKGDGWIVMDGGRFTKLPVVVQVYYPDRNVTLRCANPLEGYVKAEKLQGRKVKMEFQKAPDVHPGDFYQFRHSIRNEVCGFINMSKDVTLENIDFNFMGNFGLVGQFTENLTYNLIRCEPAGDSERTNAGFADFVQMSSCKGKIIVKNSRFAGSHDDPINIHGTHLKVADSASPRRLTVRYMHPQTFGFTPYFVGDSVDIIDRHNLLPLMSAKVTDVKQIDDYNYDIEIDSDLPALPGNYTWGDIAVENVTWTPEVEIINNYFSRTPTRGILLTTRRKTLIEKNYFFRIPMAAILVSDDARNWYESGPVKDLTIKDNVFYECREPVILVLPETETPERPVHKNILIENNSFVGATENAIKITGAENVKIRGNSFVK